MQFTMQEVSTGRDAFQVEVSSFCRIPPSGSPHPILSKESYERLYG